MPIGTQLLQHTDTDTDIEAPFGSMTWIPFGSRWPRKDHYIVHGIGHCLVQ